MPEVVWVAREATELGYDSLLYSTLSSSWNILFYSSPRVVVNFLLLVIIKYERSTPTEVGIVFRYLLPPMLRVLVDLSLLTIPFQSTYSIIFSD